MASSDNFITMEPWAAFRPSFTDPWFSERDTETLTKAFQNSLSGHSVNVSSEMINPIYKPDYSSPAQTPTISGGSENETVVSKRRSCGGGGGSAVGVNGGKITKRKPRASKRTTTTFITADPANFRQMVQQVTGIRFSGNGQMPVTPVLKPELYRPVNRLQSGCLPTLDTSAYLLDQSVNQQNIVVQPPLSGGIQQFPTPSTVVTDVLGSAGFDFDSYCSFPTLESWKVM